MRTMITGIILAGGKNSRMGSDKGLLEVGGKKIVERIVDALKPFVDAITIISNGNNYDDLGYKTYKDLIKDCGPMGGIYTALTFSNTQKNFVLSCDMPFISEELVQYMIENCCDCDIAVPLHNGKLEPLCAVYDKSCRLKLEELLQGNDFRLQDALKHFIVKQILVPDTILSKNCFANINTPDEFKALKSNKHEYSN